MSYKECNSVGLVLHVKCSGESVDHLLLHHSVARELWSFVFTTFGVQRETLKCTLVGKDCWTSQK